MEISKIKEWKDRQFIFLDPLPPFNLTRVERIIDKKIFTFYDSLYEKELNHNDIPNLEKMVCTHICISAFLPNLKSVKLDYSWGISKSFRKNGKQWKDRIMRWDGDEYIIPINDIEKFTEIIIKELKESIIDHVAFINKWDGEQIEETNSLVNFDMPI